MFTPDSLTDTPDLAPHSSNIKDTFLPTFQPSLHLMSAFSARAGNNMMLKDFFFFFWIHTLVLFVVAKVAFLGNFYSALQTLLKQSQTGEETHKPTN